MRKREHLYAVAVGTHLATCGNPQKVHAEDLETGQLARTSSGLSTPMLKIVRSATSEAVVYFLSGRIDEEHIAELQAAFDAETGAIKLDMREVTRVDRESVPALARWHAGGIEFLNCPAYLRNWISRVRTRKTSRRS